MPSLLIVDDDRAYLNELVALLRRDYDLRTAATATEARAQLAPPPDAVLLDVRLSEESGDKQGLELLDALRESLPDVPVVMMTGYSDVEIAVECMQRGALDFLQKARAQPKEIKARLAKALQTGRVAQDAAQSKREVKLFEPGGMVGSSAAMVEVKRKIAAFANGRINVLIRGEPGTGKELVAKAIHELGPRNSSPYQKINLSLYAPMIVESEIFGHTKGAYTDAHTDKVGIFEQVKGGVLFLDEIGEITLDLQIKLLRVLQEREFERMGSAGKPVKLDAQFIFATNADLEEKIAAKEFREDFYGRIKTAVIRVPPLRERPEDIPPLVEHFLKNGTAHGSTVRAVIPQVLDLLLSYSWPGNIRELENTIESATALAEARQSRHIEPEDLDLSITGTQHAQISLVNATAYGEAQPMPHSRAMAPHEISEGFLIDLELARHELGLVRAAMQRFEGSRSQKSEAAQLLGYSGKQPRFALRDRVKAHLLNYDALATEFSDLAKAFNAA